MEKNLYAEVIVDIANSNVDKVFDYHLTIPIEVGTRVLVPFGNRQIEGYIIKIKENSNYDREKIKDVIASIDDFAVLNDERIKLMYYLTKQYNLKYIDVLRLFLPSELREGKVKKLSKIILELNSEINLDEYRKSLRKNSTAVFRLIDFFEIKKREFQHIINKEFSQQSVKKLKNDGVLKEIVKNVYRRPKFDPAISKKITLTEKQEEAVLEITKFQNQTYLLHGVTGSGKTEVYMRAISKIIKEQKTAILLVPEISLTPQMLSSLEERFGTSVAILHSGLSAGERFDEWSRIINKQAQIVVGARSAIFAPLENLGLIIIDEEHDSSYNSESNPRYSTLSIATFRKNYNNCPLVLGSATPSIESYYQTNVGNYKLLQLPSRVNKKELPKIQIVDMLSELREGNDGIFSRHLLAGLKKCVEEKKQAMLFVNRRGFSSFMMCRECGYVAKCSDCDVSLVYHKSEEKLKCHFCNKSFKVLTNCPNCHSNSIKKGAVGTERVVSELAKIFPELKILRMDNDTTRNKNAHQKILKEFSLSMPAVLVGTQMIAKGHDFKDVTFVGIVDADQSLFHSDYKSSERTFQLITQMSGRAGRDENEGNVILQSYVPKHYVYRFASNYDFKGFYSKEINLRETTHFPPFSQIIRLLFSSENDILLKETIKDCFYKIVTFSESCKSDFYYLDAMKSPITRVKKKFRYQILMRITKSAEETILQKIYKIINEVKIQKVNIFIEINPQNLS